MPIYEYECPKHGVFEKLLPMTESNMEMTSCTEWSSYHNSCCGLLAIRVYSLCAMHPDNMWSGVNTQQGYFTSKEQHLSYLKNNSLERVERGMVEEVKKKAKNRVPEQLKKNEKNLEKFLGKELASM